MTTSAHEGIVPTFSRGDRLRKARTLAGLSVEDFARKALISPRTVQNYENDKVKPRALVIEKWAAVTGVSLSWLETGKAPTRPEPDGGLRMERARRYSKPQPSDPKVLPLPDVA